jgi:hypothetical protein
MNQFIILLVRLDKFLTKNRSISKFLVLGVLSILIVSNLVNAANITLNTGSRVEFGQGLFLTTTCDTYLSLKLTREFDPSTNTFYVRDLILGDISTKLHSKRVTLALRNDATDTLLTSSNLYFDLDQNGIVFTSPLTHVDSINYSSNSAFGANEVGTSSITFTNIRQPNGSKIPADDVSRFLLESSKGGGCTAPTISCATVSSSCQLGSTGPGGGPVVYISPTTFTVPPSNAQFKYIEAAPTYWYPSVDNWRDPRTGVCDDVQQFGGVSLSRSIGAAVQNTTALFDNSRCSGTSNANSTRPSGILKAAALARSYGSDWNIPTYLELIEMCKIARYGAALAPSKSSCTDAGGSTAPSGWGIPNAFPYNYWSYAASSKGTLAGQIDRVNFSSGDPNTTGSPMNSSYLIRPIRYFN